MTALLFSGASAADRPEGGYTSSFEVICFDCGDDPCRDYREVSPELQRIRVPYPMDTRRAHHGHWLTGDERRILRAGVHRSAEPQATARPSNCC